MEGQDGAWPRNMGMPSNGPLYSRKSSCSLHASPQGSTGQILAFSGVCEMLPLKYRDTSRWTHSIPESSLVSLVPSPLVFRRVRSQHLCGVCDTLSPKHEDASSLQVDPEHSRKFSCSLILPAQVSSGPCPVEYRDALS